MIYIAQIQSIVRKPICPTYIHDDETRIIISIIGIFLCCIIYYKYLKSLN
jgi:hypothetical protein